MLWNYEHATEVTLEGCYKTTPSQAKKSASIACLADYDAHNGYRMRFMKGGCFFFQFAYKYVDHSDMTVHLRYHTAYNVYDFVIAYIDGNGEEVYIV